MLLKTLRTLTEILLPLSNRVQDFKSTRLQTLLTKENECSNA